MKAISELISRSIQPTDKNRGKEKAVPLSARLPLRSKTARHATYEVEVFNFLFDHRERLGIQSVIRFSNLHLDGQIVLTDGRRLLIEVKLRMNWLKQCQAEWQFRQFLARTKEAAANPVDGAIVIFEEFSGDWNRRPSKHAKNLWGWDAWYLYSHNIVAGKPMHLLRLCNGEVQGFPALTSPSPGETGAPGS